MNFGRFLYRYRSLTPIPFVVFLLVFSTPSVISFIIGFIITVGGEVLRFFSVGYTGLTTRSKNVQTDVLVTNGPYGYVRNPIYLGNFLLSLGVVVAADTFFPWFIIIYIVLFAFQYYYIIRFEEKFLSEKFGERYEEYKKHVPSFFPKVKKFSGGQTVTPNFRYAFRSEQTTIGISLVLYTILVVIYIILNLKT
jgi:protein-S-isoprenylcysteine O-methyltransferase Ste14